MKNMKTILLFTNNYAKALEEVTESGGHVSQKFTDTVFVASLPEDVDASSLKNATEEASSEMDKISKLMADAWNDLQKKNQEKIGSESKEPNLWNDEGFEHPKNHQNDELLRKHVETRKKSLKSTGTATSEKMTGSITLGLVIVAGTASGLGFSDAEELLVVQQVMEGCQFLANTGRQDKVSFIYAINFLTIDAPPNDSCASYESCESVFRDPALQALGYPPTYQGSVDYANDLKDNNNSDWSYIAFITKYPLQHFAYAYGVNLYMNYSNDGWGPDRINQVFAHETCHVFGAADEYDSCTCGVSGYYAVPNQNCVNCTTDEICLMKNNDLTLCKWSRGQIGIQAFKTGGNIGAALMRDSNGRIYFFKDAEYNRIGSVDAGVDLGYPVPIAGNWVGLPADFQTGIDAAFTRESNGKVYMFKGDQYIRVDSNSKMDPGYPLPIAGNWPGLPASFNAGIDAALMRKSNGKIYFFKGDQYVRFSSVSAGVDPGYPAPIAGNWAGLPANFNTGIDAALWRNSNSKIYFFKGTEYVRVNTDSVMDPGYPQPINGIWFPFK